MPCGAHQVQDAFPDMKATKQKRPAERSAGRFRFSFAIDYSFESTSSSMLIGAGAFSSSIGITFDGVSGRGG